MAVTAILEMESYLQPRTKMGRILKVEVADSPESVIAGIQTKQNTVMEMLTQVMDG